MSNNAHVGELIKGWLKRQSALDEKADNARELGLDYEPSKTIIEMAVEAGIPGWDDHEALSYDQLEAFAALVRADEREACAKIVEVEAMQYAEPVWAFEIVNDIRARGQA
jgi:hypothetical protein